MTSVAGAAETGAGVEPLGASPDLGDLLGEVLVGDAVGIAASLGGTGYWVATSAGDVRPFGDAEDHGSTADVPLVLPVVGIASSATGAGYWLVAGDGGIFTFGDAEMFGSLGATPPDAPVVTMQATPTAQGYWLVDAAGRIYPFGDAVDLGTGEGAFEGLVVGAVPIVEGGTPVGMWMVDSTGAVGRVDVGGVSVDPDTGSGDPDPTPDGEAKRTPDAAFGTTPVWDGVAPANPGTTEWLSKSLNSDDSPYRWDGCRTIPYWTDLTGGPGFSRDALDDAVAEIERVSGYDLAWQGDLSYHPDDWDAFKATKRGIVVAFSDASEEPNLSGYTVGWGGYTRTITYYADGGNRSWVAAGFALADRDASWQDGWGTWSSLQVLFLHEIGHALNLGHVGSAAEIMYPSLQSLPALGPGDEWGISTMADVMPCDPNAGDDDTVPYGAGGGQIAPKELPDEPMTFTAAISSAGPDRFATYAADGELLDTWFDDSHAHQLAMATPTGDLASGGNLVALVLAALTAAGGVGTFLVTRRD